MNKEIDGIIVCVIYYTKHLNSNPVHRYVCLGGEGAVVGGASNSDQITDTTGAQKTSSAAAPVTMATMMMGGREEMVATPNGSTPSTPPTNDSLVMHATYVIRVSFRIFVKGGANSVLLRTVPTVLITKNCMYSRAYTGT
jgi:hypothetical protein